MDPNSRRIENATRQNISVRFIWANTHPDHDSIFTFRRKNDALIKETFLKTLLPARELKLFKVGNQPWVSGSFCEKGKPK